MASKKIEELKNRLYTGINQLCLESQLSCIFFDYGEDILTIELESGANKQEFYDALIKGKILKKDDQITITWK